jgi:hypothetical protein
MAVIERQCLFDPRDKDDLPLTEDQRRELDYRIAHYEQNSLRT